MTLHAGLMTLVLFAQGLGGGGTAADPKVGVLVDPIGGVVVRQAGENRGQPLTESADLLPGDRVEVDLRVAGAVTLDLGEKGKLVLGPGASLAVSTEGLVQWLGGPVCLVQAGKQPHGVVIASAAGATFGPSNCAVMKEGAVTPLTAAPLWLSEYQKGTAMRSLGTLTATVDGKELELRLARHAVTVEIRDGLALTTVENVFRNGTDHELEGVFEFPLPQDASVAEFGVWYGDRLVMADVAEKSRARAVYQTLMMERKAPGLLEVAEGNRFRTRIHPIPARGEKRVRISYTQVLGWKGDGWRYVYPLVSDMTQGGGLEELKLHVVVATSKALKAATCPSHPAAVELAAGSARVEYRAQDVVPQADFVVDIQAENSAESAVWRPYVHGKDGYFLASYVLPPMAVEQTESANGPVSWVFWVDSSGSMAPSDRKRQRDVVLTMLQSMGPADTFKLAACDGPCVWFAPEAGKADAAVREAVAQFLDTRISMGWTDLGAALASVTKGADGATQIVYLGDGFESRSLPDPVASADQLVGLLKEFPGRLHVVALGRAWEKTVLTRLAAAGKGVLVDGTAQTSAGAAKEVLAGARAPLVTLPELDGDGVKLGAVARVVLGRPGGWQQVVWVGRFDPTSLGEKAAIKVKQGGTQVAQQAATLPVEGEDNSMVMRFWARKYIDELLAGPDAGTKRDEVIGLSEEYGVISPFTSFIVIDSDAERARFGIKRLVRMGNGERFFGEGRSKAEEALTQVAMVAGQRWRRAMTQRLAGTYARPDLVTEPVDGGEWTARETADSRTVTLATDSGAMGWGGFGAGGGGYADELQANMSGRGDFGGDYGKNDDFAERERDNEYDGKPMDTPKSEGRAELGPMEPEAATTPDAVDLEPPMEELPVAQPMQAKERAKTAVDGMFEYGQGGEGLYDGEVSGVSTGESEQVYYRNSRSAAPMKKVGGKRAAAVGGVLPGVGPLGAQEDPWWIGEIVPRPWEPLKKAVEVPLPKTWPAEAVELSKSVGRLAWIRQQNGLRVTERIEYYQVGGKRPYSAEERQSTFTPQRWVITKISSNYAATTTWFENGKKGQINEAFGAARVGDAGADDGLANELHNTTWMAREPHLFYYLYDVSVKTKDGLVVLELRGQGRPEAEVSDRFEIDPAKKMVVRYSSYMDGKLASMTEVLESTQVSGVWLPARLETKGADGLVTMRHSYTWTPFAAEAAEQQFSAWKASLDRALVFALPVPGLAEAKEKLAAGKGGNADLLAVLGADAQVARFEQALGWCEKLAKANPNKVASDWLRLNLLVQARRHTEVPDLAKRLAGLWTAMPLPGSPYVASYLYRQVQQVMRGQVLVDFVLSLKPMYMKAVAPERGEPAWGELMAQSLDYSGRRDEALRMRMDLAQRYPDDLQVQQGLLSYWLYEGDPTEVLERLDDLGKRFADDPNSDDWVNGYRLDLYQQIWDGENLLKAAEAWANDAKTSYSMAHQRYIAALEMVGKPAEATKVARTWLETALKAGAPMDAPTKSRLHAALSYACGYGYNSYTGRVVAELSDLLAEIAYRGATDPAWTEFLYTVQSHPQFRFTPEGKALRQRLVAQAAAIADKDLERLYSVWDLLAGFGPLTVAETEPVVKALKKQWSAAGALADENRRYWLETMIDRIALDAAFRADRLAFKRAVVAASSATDVAWARMRLFLALTEQEPTEAELLEAAGLVAQLGPVDDEGQRVQAQLGAVDRLAAVWVQRTLAQMIKALPSTENRFERAKKAKEIATQARVETAGRLGELAKTPGMVGRLARMKQLALLVSLNKELAAAQNEAMAWMQEVLNGAEPPAPWQFRMLGRYADLAASAAVLSKEKAAVEKIGEVLEQIAAKTKGADDRLEWQLQRVGLWLATDQTAPLMEYVKLRISEGPTGVAWDIVLAALKAEKGEIKEALGLLEAAAKTGPLDGLSTALLRDLRKAQPKAGDKNKAAEELAAGLNEWELSSLVQQAMNKMRQDGSEPRMPDDMLVKVRALLQKSTYPQNHVHLIGQVFQLTGDGRVLAALFDAFPGMTSEQVGPLLTSFSYSLQGLASEPAIQVVVDEIEKARKRGGSAIFKRQLALIQLMVEKVGIGLSGTGKGHEERAATAIAAAVEGVTDADEAFGIVQTFYAIGTLGNIKLDGARNAGAVKLLEALPSGTGRRLDMAVMVGHLMNLTSGQAPAAYEMLAKELNSRLKVTEGELLTQEQSALDALVSFAVTGSLHRKAEDYVRGLFAAAPARNRAMLTARIVRLCSSAVSVKATLSLGSGATLVGKCLAEAHGQAASAGQNALLDLATSCTELLRNAHYNNLHVGPLVKELARKLESDYLPRIGPRWAQAVSTMADTYREIFSAKDALGYILAMLPKAPVFRPYPGQSLVDELDYKMVDYLRDIPILGELEKPLLDLTLELLRQDLKSGQGRSRELYNIHQGLEFTRKHAPEFAAEAVKVGESMLTCAACVQQVAQYLEYSLQRGLEAATLLAKAHAKSPLDVGSLRYLIDLWMRLDKADKAVPLARELVLRSPDDLAARMVLIEALARSKARKEAAKVLAETVTLWKSKTWWSPYVAGELGLTASRSELFAECEPLLGEAISAKQAAGGVVSRDYLLAQYLIARSGALTVLKKYRPALEDAMTGMLAAAPSSGYDQQARTAAKLVLQKVPSLKEFLAEYEKEEAATGQVVGLLHILAAQVLAEKGQNDLAVHHYRIAVETNPTDSKLVWEFLQHVRSTGSAAALVDEAEKLAQTQTLPALAAELLAAAYLDLGKPDLALRALTHGVELDSDQATPRYNLGNMLKLHKRPDDQVAQLALAFKLAPKDAGILMSYGAALVDASRNEEALKVFHEALKQKWLPQYVRSQIEFWMKALKK